MKYRTISEAIPNSNEHQICGMHTTNGILHKQNKQVCEIESNKGILRQT